MEGASDPTSSNDIKPNVRFAVLFEKRLCPCLSGRNVCSANTPCVLITLGHDNLYQRRPDQLHKIIGTPTSEQAQLAGNSGWVGEGGRGVEGFLQDCQSSSMCLWSSHPRHLSRRPRPPRTLPLYWARWDMPLDPKPRPERRGRGRGRGDGGGDEGSDTCQRIKAGRPFSYECVCVLV